MFKYCLWICILFFVSCRKNSSVSDTTLNKKIDSLIGLSDKNIQLNGTKSIAFIKEASDYEKSMNDSLLLKYYSIAGKAYRQQRSFQIALDYFYKQLAIQNSIDSTKTYNIYDDIGSIFYDLKDVPKAEYYWNKASSQFLTHFPEDKLKFSVIYSHLAILEQNRGNNTKALEMLNEYKQNVLRNKDTLQFIKANLNIANNYLLLNDYENGIRYMHRAKSYSLKVDYRRELAYIYNNLGYLYGNNLQRIDSAEYYFKKSFDLSNRYNILHAKLISSQGLYELYESQNKHKDANLFLNMHNKASEEITAQENNYQTKKITSEYNNKPSVDSMEATVKTERYLLGIGLVLIVILIIVLQLYRFQKNENHRKQSEIDSLIKTLEKKNSELKNNAISLLQSTEIIESTHKELKELNSVSNQSNKRLLSKILYDLKKGNQGFNKKEFDKLTLETDGDFYKRLLNVYPDLTRNEIRLCAFLKLNLSTKEISSLTQQSYNSIVVARSRLRKKLMLSETENLTTFLLTL